MESRSSAALRPLSQGRRVSDIASDIAIPKEGSSRGKHAFPRGSEPKANDVDARHSTAVEQSVSALAALVRERQPCVVLTGAGISTESGIPDFRSPTGIWAEYDPMEYATIGAFRRDPVKVWEFYALRFEVLTTAEPNAGHLTLAELERRGLVCGVVTQNIDGLHERAGSRDVVEVHGSIRTSSCLECVELAQGAGILLVVGSSLEVYPVAGLPEETISSGGALAIVNRGATPFDRLASIRIDGGAGETLAALAQELL